MNLNEIMSGFTAQALEKKLIDLNNSQQSIQTLSLWLIHHRKHHKSIVQTWIKELKKAKPNRKITFMYLANDVIQNSRKKGPEFSQEFGSVLKSSFENVAKESDEKTFASLDRILTVWENRNIYDSNQIKSFRETLSLKKSTQSVKESNNSIAIHENNKQQKEKRLEHHKKEVHKSSKDVKQLNDRKEKDFKKRSVENPKESMPSKKRMTEESVPKKGNSSQNQIKQKTVIEKLEKRAIIPVIGNSGPPVDPDILMKALQELENSASSDAGVRQKIASLPTEVFDSTLLDKIRDKGAAERLSNLVEEARSILADYNSRLSQELEDRKHISTILTNYTQSQREALSVAEQKLGEYKEKLRKVTQVRNELKSHLQNLPDLSRLPSVTGLAPLPSACDLFNVARIQASAGSVTSSVSPNESNASPADYDNFRGTPSSNTS